MSSGLLLDIDGRICKYFRGSRLGGSIGWASLLDLRLWCTALGLRVELFRLKRPVLFLMTLRLLLLMMITGS